VSELLEVIALYRSVGYRKLHYTYDLLVAVNLYMGNYQEAIGHGLASVESAIATQDTAYIGLFYTRLGVLHEKSNQRQAAIGFYHKVLAHFRQEHNVYMILHTARNISNNLLALGKAREALSFYQRILQEYPASDQESSLEGGQCFVGVLPGPEAIRPRRKALPAHAAHRKRAERKWSS
jgi:tetratricopeptide (TPR) repeat protein